MADDARQPLLSPPPSAPPIFVDLRAAPLSDENVGQFSDWAQEEYVSKSLRRPGAVHAETVVNADEIRAAASIDPYPVWIYGALVTPEDPPHVPLPGPTEPPLNPNIALPPVDFSGENQSRFKALDEQEIRELLIDHVGHHCCWGRYPARRWPIQKVEDCNSYIGTLETFIEERDVIEEVEPYAGGVVDSKESGRMLGAWEVDMRDEFPLLFVSRKEARKKIPHSEEVEKCRDCSGRGEIPCPKCNPNPEPGQYLAGQMTVCSECRGRGLLAHMDGSDTICNNCKGEGKLPCTVCRSRGLVKCSKCRGEGSLLRRKLLVVRWRTILHKRVSATKNAASVPDDVFHKAKGVSLYENQSHKCEPAYFPASPGLSKFSASIITERVPIPPAARVICERHQISLVPVVRVVMGNAKRSFMFYIIGLGRDIYLKDYPATKCMGCCGICTIC